VRYYILYYLCFCRLNHRVICSSSQVNCWKCGVEFVQSQPFKFWLVLVFTTFCYAEYNDSLRSSHQQLNLLFAYQQYKLAPITQNYDSNNTCCTYGQSYVWMERTPPHFTTYNFPLFKKTDWSRMPNGDKHIMKYLVCIFPTIQGKFLYLLCPKIYWKTIFSAPESMKKQAYLHCLQLTAVR